MPKDARQIPVTIGPSSDYGWLGGLALNKYVGNKASYLASGGIDPFRTPGLLQTGFVASTIINASTMQTFTGMEITRPPTGGDLLVFGIGWRGTFFQVDPTLLMASALFNLSMTNADHGFAVHANAIFYTRNEGVSITRLTRWPFTNNSLQAELNSSMVANVGGTQIKHVLVPWKSNLYCLHANNLDYLDGNGVNTGILTIGARLPSGMVVKTAVPYGDKLAIGASNNLASNVDTGTACKVYFYDGISNDWQKEIVFPENDIQNLVFNDGKLIGFGFNNSYIYNPNTNGWDIYKVLDANVVMGHKAHDISRGQVWFPGDNMVKSYGSPTDMLPSAFHAPYTGIGKPVANVGAGLCRWLNDTTLFVSSSITGSVEPKFSFLSSGASTGLRARSRTIEAGGVKFRVAWVRVVMEPLGVTDTSTVELLDNAGNTYTVGTLNGATASDGAIMSKEFFAKDFTNEPPYLTEFQLSLLFSAGNVKYRRIDMILETAPEY